MYTLSALTGGIGARFSGGSEAVSRAGRATANVSHEGGETLGSRLGMLSRLADDPLIDNNILAWIAKGDKSALDFANQYKGLMSINRTVAKEFLRGKGRSVQQLRGIMQTYDIRLISSATEAEAMALLPKMGHAVLNNDRRLVATAYKHGIKFATGDYDALNAARRLGVDVRGWRLIDDGSAVPWYEAVKRKLTSQGVKDPGQYIGPENPW